MGQPLVTILSPCYNVAQYLPAFLDSVLAQSYPAIELILVDDGSTDQTAEIISEYAQQFQKRGVSLLYLYQENAGQAAAVNSGLKHVSGEYLAWPDPDDFLTPESVARKVAFLENHGEYGWVRSNALVYSEDDLTRPLRMISSSARLHREWLLDDIVALDFMFCPGCYLARMSAYDDVNPSRDLFISRAGQNIQMMVPLAQKYPCGTIDEPLYGYVIHPRSHSRLGGVRSLEARIQQHDEIERTMIATLERLPGDTRAYIDTHRAVARYRRMRSAWEYGDRGAFKDYYSQLAVHSEVDCAARLMWVLPSCRATRKGLAVIMRLSRTVRR